MKMRWINFLPSIRMAPTLASFFFSKDLLLFSDESLVPWRRREGKRWNRHRVTFLDAAFDKHFLRAWAAFGHYRSKTITKKDIFTI